jgi:hypothetical protein
VAVNSEDDKEASVACELLKLMITAEWFELYIEETTPELVILASQLHRQFNKPSETLGVRTLRTIEVLVALIKLNYPGIEAVLIEQKNQIFDSVMGLYFTYHKNSSLSHVVYDLISTMLTGAKPL